MLWINKFESVSQMILKQEKLLSWQGQQADLGAQENK